MLFGTPEYMSPEQARGEAVDPRVDIYAMGCMLFQLVTGRVPFEADNFMGVLSMHLTEPPPEIAPETFDQIGAPRALADVIARALVKDRNARWQTMDEFAAAVRATSGNRPPTGPGPVPATPAPPRSREPTGRQKTLWTGNATVPEEPRERPSAPSRSKLPLVLALLVLLAGGGVAAYYYATQYDSSGDAGSGSAVAVASGSAPQAPAAVAEVPHDAPAPPPPPAPPPEPKLPDRVKLSLDSQPHGATVTDLASGKPIGKTPVSYEVEGSKAPRQFKFHLHGYGDTTVELVPDRDAIQLVEKLEKGRGNGAVHQIPDAPLKVGEPSAGSASGSDAAAAAVARPEAKPPADTAAAKPADTAPKPETKPAADQKCNDEDVPCLKGFGSGSQ
jgi:serine/threonine-protein kinase